MNKLTLFLLSLILLCAVSVYGQEIIFPDVVLKNVATEVQVIADENIEDIVLNGERIKVKEVGGHQMMTVKLKDDNLDFENSAVVFNNPVVIPGWLSILPPIIAIALALIFKEVLSSLLLGIFVGAASYGFYTGGFVGIFTAFFTVIDHYILNSILDSGHASVILFSVLVGSIVAIISKNGGMHGVVEHLVKYAKDRRSGMLTTYILGIAIFFDDYANSLVVGNTMRPITDKLKISREKLAYIVDSTAAPVAAVAFITTWIGAELTYISDGLDKIEMQHGVELGLSAYSVFMSSLPFAFYSVFTLVFMFFMLYKQRDFGPMLKAEKKAIAEGVAEAAELAADVAQLEPKEGVKHKAYNAIVPILIVIFGTMISLLITGINGSEMALIEKGIDLSNGVWKAIGTENGETVGFFRKLGIVIGNADSYLALLWASGLGLTVAIVMTITQKIMSLKETMGTVLIGVNTMIPAIAILILAWALADVTSTLSTAEYIKTFFGNDFANVWIVPALTFVLSAFIAFSTGSSWSTMALVYPLVIPLSYALAFADPSYSELTIMYNSIASVLTGAVLGDHCSPISDTTILSSLSTQCNHIDHVRTQMPYALTVGAVALFVGVIPAAMGLSPIISLIIGVTLLYLIVHILGKKLE